MAFKNLALDREMIDPAIKSYDKMLSVSEVATSEGQLRYEAYFHGQPKALVIIYLNRNGKTTILATSGTNPELSTRIATHIIEQSQIAVASSDTLRIKPLSKDNFELMLEYLRDECGAKISVDKAITGGRQCEITGIQGDSVKVSHYTNGTFMVQGCPVMLHSQIIEFLSEILDLHKLVDSQLTLVKTNITSAAALSSLEAHIPNAYGYIENKLKAIISPALALKTLDLELTDYTVMAFPVLKGLEGFIKQLFFSKGIVIGRDGFSPYLQLSSHNTVNDDTRSELNCDKTCTAINQCYSYYKNNRHGLFHTDGILKNTRLIKDRTTAESIVTDVLSLIESSYVEIIK
jgi:hypothetical protein